MKLSHRDRVMLTIVLVAAVWIIGVWFFIIPAFQELGEKRDELNDRQVELSKLNDKIEEDKDLPQRIEAAYNTSEELAKNFYTMQTTQNATNTVDILLDEQNIVNTDMTIGTYSVKSIKPFYQIEKKAATDFDTKVDQYESIGASSSKSEKSSSSKADSKSTIPDQIQFDDGSVFKIDPNAALSIGLYPISFNFKGKYADIQSFCEKLSKNVPGSMVVSEFSITNVHQAEEDAAREAEKQAKQNGGSTEPAPTPTPTDNKDKDGKEKSEFDYGDKEVEGTIGINLFLIKKLTKPSF